MHCDRQSGENCELSPHWEEVRELDTAGTADPGGEDPAQRELQALDHRHHLQLLRSERAGFGQLFRHEVIIALFQDKDSRAEIELDF